MTEQDVREVASPANRELAGKAMADGAHMAMTLVGTPGMGVTLDVLGDISRNWDRLMKAVGKEVGGEPLEWRVVSLAVIEDTLRIGVRAQPKRKRSRRRPADAPTPATEAATAPPDPGMALGGPARPDAAPGGSEG